MTDIDRAGIVASLDHIRKTLALLESRAIMLDDLISTRRPLSGIGGAFEEALSGRGWKHVIVF